MPAGPKTILVQYDQPSMVLTHTHTYTHNASLVLVQISLNTQGYCAVHQQLWRLFSIVWMDR